MATATQVRLVKIAQKAVGLNDQAYRVLLYNVAGVRSSKLLTNEGVEDVLSVLEDMGFEDRVHGHSYWSRRVIERNRFANARLVHKVQELAAQQDRYPLAAMCRRMSGGRVDRPDLLTPREAWMLIEAYKAIVEREQGG